MVTGPPPFTDADPFDLPEWLGEQPVTWEPETGASGVRRGARVAGRLTGAGREPVPCDLLAVDEALPVPVADEDVRRRAHLAWRHGQILLLTDEQASPSRLVLATPGTSFTADLALDAIGRLAKSVGASLDDYAALLRLP